MGARTLLAYHPGGMNPDQKRALEDLTAWLHAYQRSGRTRREFWSEFNERAAALEQQAYAIDADPELHEAYMSLLDAAHEGYGAPDELPDDVKD